MFGCFVWLGCWCFLLLVGDYRLSVLDGLLAVDFVLLLDDCRVVVFDCGDFVNCVGLFWLVFCW